MPDRSHSNSVARPDLALLAATAALYKFRGQIGRSRELLEQAFRHDALPNQRPKHLLRVRQGLSKDQQLKAERAAKDLAERFEVYLGGLPSTSGSEAIDPRDRLGRRRHPISWELLVADLSASIGERRASEWVAAFLEQCDGNDQMARYALVYQQWQSETSDADALARALIPTMVADFEELLASLTRVWYLMFPEAGGVPDAQMTVRDASSFASPVDIILWATDRGVRAFLAEAPATWQAMLRKKLNIDLSALGCDWAQVLEVFARRNALLHGFGRVDQDYLDRLPASLPRPPLGEPLTYDHEYTTATLDLLGALGATLALAWLSHFLKAHPAVPDLAADLVFEALQARRWAEAKCLAEAALAPWPADHPHHELRVNLWMARRELQDDGSADLLAEIRRWEPPADQPRFRVAKAALLRDEAQLIAELEAYQRASGPGVVPIAHWPLLTEYRMRSSRVRSLLEGTPGPAPDGRRMRSRHRQRR